MPETPNLHLRGFRKRSSLTQHDVARLLGRFSPDLVGRLEAGEQKPDLKSAFCLEFVFGAPANQLFREEYTGIAIAVRERAELLVEGLQLHQETLEVRRRVGELKAIMRRIDQLGV